MEIRNDLLHQVDLVANAIPGIESWTAFRKET